MKVGFFGKLPSYGDFVQRNVSPDFANLWDNWILQSLEVSREQLGEQWRARYFNSPIWSFVIAEGALNGHTTTGLIMPSVDKAGRCYPFTIICQAETSVNPFIMARKIDALHENCEDFILSLLEKQRPDLDEIANVLIGIYADAQEGQYQSVDSMDKSSVMEMAAVTDLNLDCFSSCNETFLKQLLDQQNIKTSIWSMRSAMGLNAQKRYFAGMPPTDNFHSFLVADGLE